MEPEYLTLNMNQELVFTRSKLRGSSSDEVDEDNEFKEAPAAVVFDRFVGIAKEWTADGKQQQIREQIVAPMEHGRVDPNIVEAMFPTTPKPKPIAPGNNYLDLSGDDRR